MWKYSQQQLEMINLMRNEKSRGWLGQESIDKKLQQYGYKDFM